MIPEGVFYVLLVEVLFPVLTLPFVPSEIVVFLQYVNGHIYSFR